MDIKEQAYNDYLDGMKYSEIAEKYGVTLNTVKSWKVRYWNKKGVQNVVQDDAHNTPKGVQPKKGGQPCNKNAVSTHEYESITYDTLTDEEKTLWERISSNPIIQFEGTLKAISIREYRLFNDIKALREKQDMSIAEVTKRDLKSNMSSGKGTQEEKYTKVVPTIDKIKDLEETLTRIQTAKIKILDKIAKLNESSKENPVIVETNSTVQIYIPDNRRD